MKWYLITMVFLLSCSTSKEDLASVRSVVTGIIEADNQSDIERVLSYYHFDAVLHPPGKPQIRGMNAIRSNYVSIFASSRLEMEIEVQDVYVEVDSAAVTGLNTGRRIAIEDGSIAEINDPFVMILRKDSGRWRIRDLRWD